MAKSTLLIEMIDLLRDRPGIEIDELAHATRRSERTIYRWLSDISNSLRMPVLCRNGGYFLCDGAAARRVSLDAQELLALRLSLRSALFAQGSPIGKHAESAWLKIRDAAPWDEAQAARDLATTHDVSVNAPPADLPPGLVETIDRAVDRRHRLHVVYRSQKSNHVSEYTIDPYALAFRRHAWYVVGYCGEHEKVIQLKLVRFIGARNTGVEFDPPADFSVERYFADSWEAWGGGEPTKVRVRFSPTVAQMIAETVRHPSQVVHIEPDGSAILEVTVSGIEEIATWIMGYGKDAEVLEPEELRNHILDHATGMARLYSSIRS